MARADSADLTRRLRAKLIELEKGTTCAAAVRQAFEVLALELQHDRERGELYWGVYVERLQEQAAEIDRLQRQLMGEVPPPAPKPKPRKRSKVRPLFRLVHGGLQ